MPSTRRIKAFVVIVAISVLSILYITNKARQDQYIPTQQDHDFYASTINAMEKLDKQEAEASSFRMDKLKEVERASKKSNSIATNRPSSPLIPADDDDISSSSKTASIPKTKVNNDANISEKSVAGRKKMKGGEKYDMATGKEAAMVVDKEGTSGKDISSEKKEETQEEHEIEVELNLILKKGPIIIFSKTSCPFSKKAKAILLEKYNIVPAPYVVELDNHPLGPGLQSALYKSTGRKTVPNILINGKSIGGGDEVEALHENRELIDKIKSMGGKRIMEAKLAGS